MKQGWKRGLALLLTLGVYAGSLSMTALAAQPDEAEQIVVQDGAVGEQDGEIRLMDATASSNAETIYRFLMDEVGLNAAGACGVLANIEKESSFDPQGTGDGGTSYGICQWHGERWTAMKKWCAKNGWNPKTLTGQLQYLKFELSQNNSAYLWNGKTIYTHLASVDNTAEGAYDAGHYWCWYYEVPANRAKVAVVRGNLAKNTYYPNYALRSQPLAITGQPREAKGTIGRTVKFSVKTTGIGLSYEWQYKNKNGTAWKTSASAGSKTGTITVKVTKNCNGRSFRCVVTDSSGETVTSDSARCTIR